MNPEPDSPPQASVLLIDPDQTSAAFMRHMLKGAGYQVAYAPTGKEGLIVAYRDQPDAVLLEVELPDMDGLDFIRRVAADPRTQRAWVLCLTKHGAPETAQQAYELGAKDYVVKQADAVDLVLQRLADMREATGASESARRGRVGHVVAFLSAKGGVGTTSLCLNFAQESAISNAKKPVAVVDLVLPIGSMARMTGEQPELDIVEMTSSDEYRQAGIEDLRAELPIPEGWAFYLIAGANNPSRASELKPDHLAPLLQNLRIGFRTIFVDVGRTLSDLSLMVLRQADVLVTVVSPSTEVVETTAGAMAYLSETGIRRERFFVVTNRPLGVEDLSVEEVEMGLNHPVDAAVPYLRDTMYISNRLHLPLDRRFASETGTVALKKAAQQLIHRTRVFAGSGQPS